jgi:hypothetical protein
MRPISLSAVAVPAVVAVVGSLALALTGCTPASAPVPSASRSASATTAPGLPAGVSQATDVPTKVPNDPSARSAVSTTECAAVDGGWRAAGSAKNPGDAARTYEITVFFTTSTATVLATGTTSVEVEPGATAEWSIAKDFTAPSGTLCVLAGVH